MLSVGQMAPDFVAPAVRDGEGRLLQLLDVVESHEAVLLAFAPCAFVPTCTADLRAVRDAGWDDREDLAVLALSGDSTFSHAAYADECDLPLTFVSDFHGRVAESYGLLAEEWEGHGDIPTRAAVLVDGDWTVRAIATADPLARASPAPVETVAESLGDLGVDAAVPVVAYGE